MPFLVAFLIILLFSTCYSEQNSEEQLFSKSANGSDAAIVTAHHLATEAGLEVLREGGTAADAMIASQFALAVVCPRAGNIGGGGFCVYRTSDGSSFALDFRETAPLKSSRDMYLNEHGNPLTGMSLKGYKAVGTPGTVSGLSALHARLGTKPWNRLLEPAIRLAKTGFAVSESEASRLNLYQSDFATFNPDTIPFRKASPWKEGDTLKQPTLAGTLELIAQHGKNGFYEGKVAQAIETSMTQNGGFITKDDLEQYTPIWRNPLIDSFRNFRIISMPPPSSGGVALIQMLQMIDKRLDQCQYGSEAYIHLIAEAARRAYADRAAYLGDPEFSHVPVAKLTGHEHLTAKMTTFHPDTATLSLNLADTMMNLSVEQFETTHTSIVDAFGHSASLTTTLNSNYGSKVWVHGGGFFLNNEMDDFSIKPGVPNQFGLVGAEANAIAPKKRMLSSMTPTIIEKNGNLFLVLGTPGGSTIITSVLQVFLNTGIFYMPLDEAITAGRFHHQWLPDEILYEKNSFPKTLQSALKKKGHVLREVNRIGLVKAILQTPDGTLEACGDQRNPDDNAAAY